MLLLVGWRLYYQFLSNCAHSICKREASFFYLRKESQLKMFSVVEYVLMLFCWIIWENNLNWNYFSIFDYFSWTCWLHFFHLFRILQGNSFRLDHLLLRFVHCPKMTFAHIVFWSRETECNNSFQIKLVRNSTNRFGCGKISAKFFLFFCSCWKFYNCVARLCEILDFVKFVCLFCV